MRKEWRKATIGEVCEVVNGGTPKTGVTANWGGSHMWITPAEMGGRSDPYVGETERQLTQAGLAAANLLPPQSVILSSRAPIGHLVINTVPMATNQGCKGLVPKGGLDHKYLFYYLGSIVGLLNDLGTGATFKELSGGKLKEVSIPLPPLPEQQRIVAILDEVFAGLATAIANAAKNVENARELFDDYLNSVFATADDEWKQTTLGEIAEFKNGLNFTKSSKGETIRIVGVKDFQNNFWIPTEQLDDVQIEGGLNESYVLRKDDILTVRSNGNKQLIGRTMLAADISERASHSGFTIRIRITDPNVNPVYLVRYLKSDAIRKAFDRKWRWSAN